MSNSAAPAPSGAAIRRARRSYIELFIIGGLPLAGLVTGAIAQTAITADDTNLTISSNIALTGTPAVTVGSTTPDNNVSGSIITVGSGVSVETTDADAIRIENGSSGAVVNQGTIVANSSGAAVSIIAGVDNRIHNSGSISTVGSSIAAAAGTTGTIVWNPGTILASGAGASGVLLSGVNTDAIINDGAITVSADGGDAIRVGATSSGMIANNDGATIDAALDGIHVGGITTIDLNLAQITNGGRIDAGHDGIAVDGDSGGHISNDATGTITAGRDGVFVGGGYSIFGNILNQGRIVAGADGVHLSGNNIGGALPSVYILSKITNTGSIAANEVGIFVGGSNCDWIENVGRGVIESANADGIHVGGANNAYASLIRNSASIGTTTNAVGDDGIEVAGLNEGEITNGSTGMIFAKGDGIVVGGNVKGLTTRVDGQLIGADGRIVNAGTITAGQNGILVSDTNFGAITNSGTITAQANGVLVAGGNSQSGRILNGVDGTINAATGVGLHLGGTNHGEIENSGSIVAGTDGIRIVGDNADDEFSHGGITNDGAILASEVGIRIGGTNSGSIGNKGDIGSPTASVTVGIQAVAGNGGVIANTDAASRIYSSGDAILVGGGVIPANNGGVIFNSGTLVAGGAGIHVTGANAGTHPSWVGRDPTVAGLGVSTVVGNDGTINSTGNGIQVDGTNGTAEFRGSLYNNGRIVAQESGIAVGDANYREIVNYYEGSISATDSGILVGGANFGGIGNGGLIETGTGHGIFVVGDNSGQILNVATGTINAASDGIYVGGGNAGATETESAARIVNAGTLTSMEASGIHVAGANTGTLRNIGTITSSRSGMIADGDNAGMMENLGTLNAYSRGALYVGGDNSGTLRNGATGVIDAIRFSGISGFYVAGRNLAGAGLIENLGSIQVGDSGVFVGATNAGRIVNAEGAIIKRNSIGNAGDIGIMIGGSNAGSVLNSGAISVNYDGIYVSVEPELMERTAAGVLVGNSGTIENSETGSIEVSDGYGLSVRAQNSGFIVNAGLIEANFDGVYLAGANAGSIENSETGSIVTAGSGISVTGRVYYADASLEPKAPAVLTVVPSPNTGTITNAGEIDAGSSGLHLVYGNGGTITNTATGTILAERNGIYVVAYGTKLKSSLLGAKLVSTYTVGNEGNIYNYGQIGTAERPVGGAGIYVIGDNTGLIANGTATDHASAAIYSDTDGIRLRAANSGSISNVGSINAVGKGIVVGEENQDDTAVIYVANSGTIANAGTITVTGTDGGMGIYIAGDNAGTVDNLAGATIAATNAGILASAANTGTVRNAGSIEAGMFGIGMAGNNAGLLENQGRIAVSAVGLVTRSNTGTIRNTETGTLSATAGYGIIVADRNAQGALLENAGTIEVAEDGIRAMGDPSFLDGDDGEEEAEEPVPANPLPVNAGTIRNTGTITAGSHGISVGDPTAPSFMPGATEAAEDFSALSTLVANSGTIENLAGASITAGANGIYVGGLNSGTVLNAGAIEAEANGILVTNENTGEIANSGTITAGRYGILVNGGSLEDEDSGVPPVANSGSIQNTGTIGVAGGGIVVAGENTGDVLNIGVIDTRGYGIVTGINTGLVRNAGSIVSTRGAISIYGDNSGTVENAAGATISTRYDGIEVYGANTATGRILNGAGASIETVFPGIVVFSGNAGLIENSGSVSSEVITGIYVVDSNTGTIHNTATGSIAVAEGDGIQLRGANAVGASILNEGSIAASSNGIWITQGNAGSIANLGTIGSEAASLGESGIFVYGDNTGSIRNGAGAGIVTQVYGIAIVGANAAEAAIDNAGSIVSGQYGIIVADWEDDDGEHFGGNNAGTISNSGTIEADRVGILVNGDSNVLANTGSIAAGNAGITILGDAATTSVGSITTTGNAASGLFIAGDAGTVDASGTVATTGAGILIDGAVATGLTNTGSIVTTGAAADGIRIAGTATVVNRGSIAVGGEGSYAIDMTGAAQTLVNSGTLASAGVAVASNGDDTVVMATGASVTGAIAASAEGSTLYFGAAADVVPSGDLLASGSSAFNMTYGGAASSFNTVFLAGTTNFNGASAVSALNTSAILAGATFRANSTVQFTATGALPTGLALPTTTASDVALYNMGTLGGAGTVSFRSASGGLGTLVNTGTIAPGNSIDTLTIDGNVQNTGTLAIELGAATCDLIRLTSGVSGSTATFTFASGSTVAFAGTGTTTYTPGDTFNFMKADSSAKIVIEGTPVFSYQLLNTTDTLPDYKFYVVGNSGTLSGLSDLYAVVARDHAYEKFATTDSQSVVGLYLDGHRSDASFADLLLNLDLVRTDADFNAALELMSGEIYPSLVTLENERIGEVIKSVATALRPLGTAQNLAEVETFEPRWYTFAQASVASSDASDDQVADIDSRDKSVLAGVGCQVYPKWDIGGFLNVGDGKAENDHPDEADIGSVDLGAFGRYNNAGDYYYASVAYSSSSFEVERQAAVARSHPLVAQAAVRTKGEFDGKQFTVYLEKGYTFEIGKSILQPYAAFQYAKGSYDRFTETGDGLLDLTVDFEDFTSLRGILGATWRYEINRTFGVALRGSWGHEFRDEAAYVAASFRGTSDTYRLRGLEMGSDRFNAGFDVSVRLTDKFSACLRADYTVSDGQEIESANIGFRYGW